MGAIIRGEYALSRSILDAGYNLASLQMAYANVDWSKRHNWKCNGHRFAARSGQYFGISMHPFETIFHKIHWETNVSALQAHVRAEEAELYATWQKRSAV